MFTIISFNKMENLIKYRFITILLIVLWTSVTSSQLIILNDIGTEDTTDSSITDTPPFGVDGDANQEPLPAPQDPSGNIKIVDPPKSCPKNEDYYNILTMDGGGIKGIITASCVIKIEAYAYKYAMQFERLCDVP